MTTTNILLWGLRFAGVGQLFIAGIYFWVRNILGWDADMARLRPHNRAIAQTYARYIQALNAAFGTICLLWPQELLTGTRLAAAVTLLIGIYWTMRIVLQLTYYALREITDQRKLYRYGHYAFGALFAAQGAILLAAFAFSIGWLGR
jgi:hypothetical protein